MKIKKKKKRCGRKIDNIYINIKLFLKNKRHYLVSFVRLNKAYNTQVNHSYY